MLNVSFKILFFNFHTIKTVLSTHNERSILLLDILQTEHYATKY